MLGLRRLKGFLMNKSSSKKAFEAKYKVLERIGKGSFSTVKLARSRETGDLVAVKILKKKGTRVRAEDVERELEILGQVQHPNIVRMLEYFDTPKRCYLVLEYAAGGEVFDRLVQRGAYTEADARAVIHSVLRAVAYLHTRSIVHRDLKPENLLYSHATGDLPTDLTRFYSQPKSPRTNSENEPDSENDFQVYSETAYAQGPRVLLTDFGFSRSVAPEAGPMRTNCGTLSYCAPEILLQQPYQAGVDVWSIGALAFTLLAGRAPFDEAHPDLTTTRIIEGRYSFAASDWDPVSPLAKDFIRAALTVNPARRITAHAALRHPWFLAPLHALPDTRHAAMLLARYSARRKFRAVLNTIRASRALTLAASSPTTSPSSPIQSLGAQSKLVARGLGRVPVSDSDSDSNSSDPDAPVSGTSADATPNRNRLVRAATAHSIQRHVSPPPYASSAFSSSAKFQ